MLTVISKAFYYFYACFQYYHCWITKGGETPCPTTTRSMHPSLAHEQQPGKVFPYLNALR